MEINLRQLEKKDASLMLEWMHDKDVTQYLKLDGDTATMESVLAFIENASTNKEQNLHYAITNEANTYLGTISLKNIDKGKKEAELAIVLHRNSMGKGVATSAIQKLLGIASQELKLNKVYLNVLQENKRAVKLYEKLGFKCTRTTEIEFHGQMKMLDWYEYKNRG